MKYAASVSKKAPNVGYAIRKGRVEGVNKAARQYFILKKEDHLN